MCVCFFCCFFKSVSQTLSHFNLLIKEESILEAWAIIPLDTYVITKTSGQNQIVSTNPALFKNLSPKQV